MDDELSCPKCGGQMDSGKMQPAFLNYTSDNANVHFLSLGPEVKITKAHACLVCGYVEMYLDADVLKRKVK